MDAAGIRVGDLSETLFCELLASLSRERETGVLRLFGPTAEKSVYLQQGSVVFASSKDPSDRLGELLLQRGTVTREQLEQAAAKLSPGKRLGTVLVELGFLPAEDLPRWVREQVKEIIFSLFAWIEGEYRFEPGPFPSREAITLRISTAEIFVTGLRRVQKWSVLRRGAGEIRIPYRLSPNHADLLRDVALGAEEKKILALLGSRSLSMEKAAVESALSTLTVYQLFFAFRVLGVILASEEPVPVAKAQATDSPPETAHTGEGKQQPKSPGKIQEASKRMEEAEPVVELVDSPLLDPEATLRFVPPAPTPEPAPSGAKKQEKTGKGLAVPKSAVEAESVVEQVADSLLLDPDATLRFVPPVPMPPEPVSSGAEKTEEKPAGKTRGAAPKKVEVEKPRVAQSAPPSPASAPKAATQPESNPVGAQTVIFRIPTPQGPPSPKKPMSQPSPAAPEAHLTKITDSVASENQAATPTEAPSVPVVQAIPVVERPARKKDPTTTPAQKAATMKETAAPTATPTAPRGGRTEYKVVKMEAEKMDENGARQIEDLLRTWSGKGYRFAGVLPSKASGLFTSTGAFFFIFARDIPS